MLQITSLKKPAEYLVNDNTFFGNNLKIRSAQALNRIFLNWSFRITPAMFFMNVLDAMKNAGVPLNAGKIAELTKLDRKAVDKAVSALKSDGIIVSPKRCFWQPK